MRLFRTAPIAAALAVGALALSACSSQGTGPSAESATTAGDRVQGAPTRVVAAMSLPLDAYQLSPEDYERSQQALWQLTTACMQDVGFTSFAFTPSTGTSEEIEEHEDLRYGTYDQQDAERLGYRPDFGGHARVAAIGGEEPHFTPEEEAALDGEPKKVRTARAGEPVPEDGCYGQALDQLTGGQSETYLDDTLVEELDGLSYEKSLQDPKVAAVFARWSACMASKNFAYKSPIDANNDASFTGDTAGPKEKQVAVADTQCKSSTDLVSVWHDAEVAAQRTLISERGPELAKAQALNATIRAKSDAVLG
ncbi:hypothetical protein [Streptomyces africanus]|uniref:hypothetical protein n=1 Tax=Streptomyces africanus TaxID=231024 RepID=UPI001180AAD4|nr:hypothetical protein [Streptomyces africanus]